MSLSHAPEPCPLTRLQSLYLITLESHFVSLTELLADSKLLLVSNTVVSVEDCLDKIRGNVRRMVEQGEEDFIGFVENERRL